jgi:hypothetical protein
VLLPIHEETVVRIPLWRFSFSLIGVAALAVAGVMIVSPATAEAACTSIPANHDPNVIRVVYQVGVARGVSDRVMLAGFEAGWVE